MNCLLTLNIIQYVRTFWNKLVGEKASSMGWVIYYLLELQKASQSMEGTLKLVITPNKPYGEDRFTSTSTIGSSHTEMISGSFRVCQSAKRL